MKKLPCEIKICMITILLACPAALGLISYEDQILDLENQIIRDKIYYQYQMDSLKSIINDLERPRYHFNQEPDDRIINALIQIESGGNDDAYCVEEDAVGALQIRRTMVRDVNRILKRQGSEKRYEYKDRWCRQRSIEMFNIYRDYYNLVTPEEIARCWNGGPKGIYKPATVAYWNKVKNHLDS
tara:strand:- start:8522 stop:9073 length:552 start_codon:yes stop_codon:yes gene_type:complete